MELSPVKIVWGDYENETLIHNHKMAKLYKKRYQRASDLYNSLFSFFGLITVVSSSIATTLSWGSGDDISPNQQYIFVSNHESMLDIPVALSLLPYNIIFLTKKELFKIPFFGWAMNSAGMIRVNRQNREKAKISVEEALKSLKKKNINVLVYPEGTRTNPNQMLKFKKGSFILAIESGLPIVPLTTLNTGKNLPSKQILLNDKIIIKLKIHPPIETKGLSIENDKNHLCNLTHDIILNDLKKYV